MDEAPWRLISVWSDTPLDILHVVIQALFLWDDEHPHQFTFNKKTYAAAYSEAALLDGSKVESEYFIGELLTKKGQSMLYKCRFVTEENELALPMIVEGYQAI